MYSMRRLRRTMLFAAATLSLLVCLGSAALWIQSYRLCGRYETPHQRPFHWSLDADGMGHLPSELWWVQWQIQWRRGRFAVIRSNLVFFQEHKGDTLGASCSCLLVEEAGAGSYIRNPRRQITRIEQAPPCH